MRHPANRPPARRRPAPFGAGNGLLGAIALALALLASCLLPSSVLARHVIAPPGNAGVEQYVEVLPGAEGNEPVRTHNGKGGAISQSTQRRLEALGPEGKAAASFAQATGSSAGHRGKARRSKHVNGSATQAGAGSGRGGGSGPAGTHGGGQAAGTTAGGGIGVGLPLALTLIALLALGGALLRRRSLSS